MPTLLPKTNRDYHDCITLPWWEGTPEEFLQVQRVDRDELAAARKGQRRVKYPEGFLYLNAGFERTAGDPAYLIAKLPDEVLEWANQFIATDTDTLSLELIRRRTSVCLYVQNNQICSGRCIAEWEVGEECKPGTARLEDIGLVTPD